MTRRIEPSGSIAAGCGLIGIVIHFETKSGNQQGVSLILSSKMNVSNYPSKSTSCCNRTRGLYSTRQMSNSLRNNTKTKVFSDLIHPLRGDLSNLSSERIDLLRLRLFTLDHVTGSNVLFILRAIPNATCFCEIFIFGCLLALV